MCHSRNMVLEKVSEIVKTAIIIYTIRRFNPISTDRAKYYYILLLSPILLTLALLQNNSISWKYRKFLINFTYPKNEYTKLDTFKKCRDKAHPNDTDCRTSFKNDLFQTISKILKMYLRLYTVHGIIFYIVNNRYQRKQHMTTIARKELINTMRSSIFLTGQTILQRGTLCLLSSHDKSITPWKLYIGSVLGSVSICVERPARAQQLNNLILSHIIVGQLKKRSIIKSQLPWWLLTGVVIYDTFYVKTFIFIVSLVSSVMF